MLALPFQRGMFFSFNTEIQHKIRHMLNQIGNYEIGTDTCNTLAELYISISFYLCLLYK